MGWFDEQIRDRKRNDDEAFAEAFANMASAITGRKIDTLLNNDRVVTKDAIDEILRYYHVKSREVPDGIGDVNEQLEYLMRPYGIMRRTVKLEDGWYRATPSVQCSACSATAAVLWRLFRPDCRDTAISTAKPANGRE